MNDFIALDVETATPKPATICQVGIVVFKDGRIDDTFLTLVNPRCGRFYPRNIQITGIDEHMVQQAPTFRRLYTLLDQVFRGNTIATYGPFDRVAVAQACEREHLAHIACTWLDIVRVARQAWPVAEDYKLPTIGGMLGIRGRHHDAQEDARVAGEILVRALQVTATKLADWEVSP